MPNQEVRRLRRRCERLGLIPVRNQTQRSAVSVPCAWQPSAFAALARAEDDGEANPSMSPRPA
jgi:hypothetical protein